MPGTKLEPLRAPAFFGGVKRKYGTVEAEEAEDLLKIAAHFGGQPPLKRPRALQPERRTLMSELWTTRLSDIRIRRLFHVADEYGKLVDERAIAITKASEEMRKSTMHKNMPVYTAGTEIVCKEWSHRKNKPGIVRVKVAKQAKDGVPKHFVVFYLPKDRLVQELAPISEMFELLEEDGVPLPASGLSFTEGEDGDDADNIPTINIDTVDETPEDWALMCSVLFRPQRHVELEHHWDDIGRLLELARKYECYPLRCAAVHTLSKVFPTVHDNFRHRFSDKFAGAVYGQPAYWAAEALLRYALPYRLHELLPVIRYEVASQYTIEELLLGWPEVEGHPAMQIPDDELERLLRGQETLTHMRRLHTLAPLVNLSRVDLIDPNCTHENEGYRCHHVLGLFADGLLANEEIWGPKFALRALDGRSTKVLKPFVCTSCFSALKTKIAAAQREAWRMLPSVFGMGTWFDVQIRADWVRKNDYEWWLAGEAERERAEVIASNGIVPSHAELKQQKWWTSFNEMSKDFLHDPEKLEYLEDTIDGERTALTAEDRVYAQVLRAEASNHGLKAHEAKTPRPFVMLTAQFIEGFVTGVAVPENPNFVITHEQEANALDDEGDDFQAALEAGALPDVDEEGGEEDQDVELLEEDIDDDDVLAEDEDFVEDALDEDE